MLAPSPAESRSAGDVELHPNRQDVAEGGGGQAFRRSIRTREEQDAPWRIRVRSAVRLLPRGGRPPPPPAPPPPPSNPGIRPRALFYSPHPPAGAQESRPAPKP